MVLIIVAVHKGLVVVDKSLRNGAWFREILVLADFGFANDLNPQKWSKTGVIFQNDQKVSTSKVAWVLNFLNVKIYFSVL